MNKGKITKVSGPLIEASGLSDANIYDVVEVSKDKLIGEIIEMRGDVASIQVYEETTGIGPGDEVVTTGHPLSVELGPGMLEKMYDGIQRPLEKLQDLAGEFLKRGVTSTALDREKTWEFNPTASVSDKVEAGDILGEVEETSVITHKIMVPIGVSGTIKDIKAGEFTVDETIAIIETEDGDKEVSMLQKWPVRQARPSTRKIDPDEPLITGQRVIDTFFPVAKGGTAAIPGPFGSGKTVVQHQIAKFADADIVIYVGCGERGNEMTDVLNEFPELIDPKTGESIMKRTVLIANTSNMPVAAREASIYTGVTLAEYFRDMGYHVALMGDSTSRWAEALREISGRLEEMPAEEGYPAYLPSRIAGFYERAGYVNTLSGTEGSVTLIGAVSPAGGDFSEPVTENTKRFVNVFLALDKELAYSRHYPAINWMNSYSGYIPLLKNYYDMRLDGDLPDLRIKYLDLLHKEAKLNEIVMLVGEDVLPDEERLVLEICRVVKVGFLQQNAFNPIDTFVPLEKQFEMLKTIDNLYERGKEALKLKIPISVIKNNKLYGKVINMKYDIENENLKKFVSLNNEINDFYVELASTYGDVE
ncbi:V-type ATP synthase subunit A [uncultured Peptoniphilus sp.]|uniref:V-type ATP synthase subunit A n=1 Tax=uncultured Peptoniphilus sp. TaxID=254354 RepID=UPI0025929DEF|nr:V-type ATP synthase subunit A [uncultured Peptoniphilus sp.]